MHYFTISSALHADSISINLSSTTKAELFDELIGLLEKSGKVTDKTDIKEKLIAREKVASTAIEGGIAMPHIKSNGISEVCMAVGISQNGIPCGAPDGLPTKIFVLAASPDDPTSSYLSTLVNLIDEFKDKKIRDEILACSSSKEVYEILSRHDHKMYEIEQ